MAVGFQILDYIISASYRSRGSGHAHW